MLRRLVETFRLTTLASLPQFPPCLMFAAELTCQVIRGAVKEDVDETWNMETFDDLLECWVALSMFIMSMKD